MRILHTADWHVGKRLGRVDRSSEVEAVMDEMVAIASDRDVDAILVAGDLFDRAGPPLDTMRLVIDTLRRLADTGAQVVAVPGNHDSAGLFQVLAPLLSGFGITFVHRPLEPDAGGIVTVPARDGSQSLRVICLPFIHEAQVIEVMKGPDAGYKTYSDRLRAVTRYYADHLVDNPDSSSVDVLMGHFMVQNAVPSGSERPLHIGEAYMATSEAIPATIKYGALGHIHIAQEAPGTSVPARFAGSLIQLDFGEAGQEKSVCIVDVEPGLKPARVETVPLNAARTLMKVKGTLEQIAARAQELKGSWLHVTVETEGPSPSLSDQVRDLLGDNVLQVHAWFEKTSVEREHRQDRILTDLYADYRQETFGVPPSPELAKAFASAVEAAEGSE